MGIRLEILQSLYEPSHLEQKPRKGEYFRREEKNILDELLGKKTTKKYIGQWNTLVERLWQNFKRH